MKVKIYKPAKSAMQSGRAGTKKWVLEYEPQSPRRPEPLMGWTSAHDTMDQIRIKFDTKEAAVAFAKKAKMDYTVVEPNERKVVPKNYVDNFRCRA